MTSEIDKWWGKVDNKISKEGDEFQIRFGKAYWKFRTIQFKPSFQLVWLCIDGYPEMEREWIGTELSWNLENGNSQTVLSFEHNGLTPSLNCYHVCAPTWDTFLTRSLKSYCETNIGYPQP